MYLVDTNVISEARKGKKANPGVQRFFQAIEAEDLYLSVQTIGEIRRGLENIRHRGDLPQAKISPRPRFSSAQRHTIRID